MFYEYQGIDCPNAPVVDGKKAVCHHTISLPVSQCQELGAKRPCPVEGCKGCVTRVLSTDVNVIIRGQTPMDWKPGQSAVTRINGQDVRFQFVDHPGTDPKNRDRLAGLAKAKGLSQNGISKAYYNEKFGQMCVDVASTIPDPLGAMKRASAQQEPAVKQVRQPYRRRKMKYNPARQRRGVIPIKRS